MAWSRNRTMIAAGGAAVAGLVAALFTRRWWSGGGHEPERPAAALSRGKSEPGPAGQSGAARSAGPEAMRDPPSDWGKVDQAADESFPATDPPGISPHVD